MKVVYYLAASLDGYIADDDGGVDWLDKLAIDHQNIGYEEFFAGIDSLLMGRNTYDFVHDHGQWPYGNKPTWVCTSRPLAPLDGCNLQRGTDPKSALVNAESLGMESVWLVGGGALASSMLEEGILTHMSVSVMPVILGSGVKLFSDLPGHVYLHQEQSRVMPGFTQIEYKLST